MNWGKSIVVVLIIFIAFIMTMVVQMFRTNVDLAAENYYEKDLNFEKEIVAHQNGLDNSKSIEVTHHSDHILISKLANDVTDILVILKRPNNDKLDQTFEVGSVNKFIIPKEGLEQGFYEIEIQFLVNNKLCLQHKKINI